MEPIQPTKGRIVNYHCLEGERYLGADDDLILPAIITNVNGMAISLTVFTNQPSSLMVRRTAHYGSGPGEWSDGKVG